VKIENIFTWIGTFLNFMPVDNHILTLESIQFLVEKIAGYYFD